MKTTEDDDVNPLASDFTAENRFLALPPDMEMLESALGSLPNNCDHRTLALYRVSPFVRDARNFPETADALHGLLLRWFLGTLTGVPTAASTTKGPNGVGGVSYFESLWQYFLNQRAFKGKPTTLGSVYFHAKARGWVYMPGYSAIAGEAAE